MVLLPQVQVQLQLPEGQAARTAQHQWAFARVTAHEMRTLDVRLKSIGPQCLPGVRSEKGRRPRAREHAGIESSRPLQHQL